METKRILPSRVSKAKPAYYPATKEATISSKIKRLYFNPSLSGSFSATSGFLKNRQFKNKDKVTKELQRIKEVYLHKPTRKKFKRRKIYVPFTKFQIAADLLDLSKYSRINKGNTFILIIIDAFSRFIWAYPIKNKSADSMTAAFTKFFKENGNDFRYLHVDQGLEFTNKKMKELLTAHKVKLFHTYAETKSSMAERAIRTIMQRLERYFTYTQNHKYLDVLPKLVNSYNSSIHSAHGFRPRDVNKLNEAMIWERLYSKYFAEPIPKPKFKVNDKVRTSKLKSLFTKGYAATYLPEIFTIHLVKKTRPITYVLKDEMDEIIQGSFYENELQLVQ
jgi:transposase InsO family protein